MQKFYAGLLVACLGGLMMANGQAVTTQYDHIYNPAFVVKAFHLTPTQEQDFDEGDGKMSKFWYAWEQTGVLKGTGDKAVLDWSENKTWGDDATGQNDVGFNIRFAYGAAGIYLLFECFDDNYVPAILGQKYVNDGLELFAETKSATELYNNAAANFPCLDAPLPAFANQLTSRYFQIQVPFGGDEQTEFFSWNYWNPSLIGSTTCLPGSSGEGFILYDRERSIISSRALGVMIEILPQEGSWRRSEWRIPWGQWGAPNVVGGLGAELTPGNSIAICFGYNDLDEGMEQPTALRWRKADPYSNDNNGHSADAWGDLKFDASIDDLLAAAGLTYGGMALPVRNPLIKTLRTTSAAKTEFYSVNGRKLDIAAARASLPASALVLRKSTLADGRVVTSRVQFGVAR
jgi:hypothetical protein